jgi:acetyl-CoA carboxylase carboxyltransferase component
MSTMNQSSNQQLVEQMANHLEKIKLGGGLKNIAKQHDRGKLTARERIAYLIDPDTTFLELGAFVGFEMYKEYGGCPAGGTVGGIGYVSGKQCMIVANDQTVKAGAYFPITGKRIFVCRK